MIKPLSYQTLITMGHMCGLCNPVYVMDIRSGKIYAGAHLDVDPVSEHVFAYTEDGAFWSFEYGETWWAYSDAERDIPTWDI